MAEAGTYDGVNAVAYGNDDVKVVTKNIMILSFSFNSTMRSGYSEFPNNHRFVKFTLFENVGNMFTYGRLGFIEL